jgi:hypothetical protein
MTEVQSEQAAMRSEVHALAQAVGRLSQVPERTAVLVEQVGQLEKDVSRVEAKFDKRWDSLEVAQNDARKDSRSLRNIMIGVAVAAVLSPIGGILVALAVGKA